MLRIYSHPDTAMVHLVKNELENRGIEALIRGEHAAAVFGGGAGIDAWTELWVVDDARAEEAAGIIKGVIEQTPLPEGEPWRCPNCGEEVEASFAVCWNCGEERPEQAA